MQNTAQKLIAKANDISFNEAGKWDYLRVMSCVEGTFEWASDNYIYRFADQSAVILNKSEYIYSELKQGA